MQGKIYMKYLFYVCVRFQAVKRIINLIIACKKTRRLLHPFNTQRAAVDENFFPEKMKFFLAETEL